MTSIRNTYIDYLRGFMFMLMAFDHTLHAYAQNWGRFWFIQDFERSSVWDAFYLFDQSIIMPMIFFIAVLTFFFIPAVLINQTLTYGESKNKIN